MVCERTDDETEFLRAVAGYQKQFDRRYPTWREILHILRCLGYRKVAERKSLSKPLPPPNHLEQAEPKIPK